MVSSPAKGFARDTRLPADAEPRPADQPQLATAVSPSDLGSGRGFKYEWEEYMADVLDRLQVVESGGSGRLASMFPALTNVVAQVSAAPGLLGGYMLYNPGALAAYVQVFDALVADVTLGTTAPAYVLPIPAGSAANLDLASGVTHDVGIAVAATNTPEGAGAPDAPLTATFFYK